MEYLIVVVQMFFNVLQLLIILKVLLSWFPGVPLNPLTRFINDTAGPILRWASKIIPPVGMFDISPILVVFGLDFLNSLIISLLSRI